jgi:group I intron endonuclease
MAKPKRNDVCSIYVITNIANGKLYVGHTWQKLHRRFRGHINDAIRDPQWKLERAICKYGEENFIIELIEEFSDQSTADYFEDFYILAGDTIKNGYNIRRGGKGGRWSEASKKRFSKRCKGRIISPEQRAKLSKTLTGRKIPQDVIERRSKTVKERGSLKGSNAASSILNERQVKRIKEILVEDKTSHDVIAKRYGVSIVWIAHIASGRRWSHVKVKGTIPQGHLKGERHNKAKLTEKDVLKIRKLFDNGKTVPDICKLYPYMDRNSIWQVANRKTWKHVK